jgi:hypothetical protein
MPPAPALRSIELIERRIRVADADVVWLRSVLEGYDGLAALYGDGSGVVVLSTTASQAAELDSLLDELRAEAALLELDR